MDDDRKRPSTRSPRTVECDRCFALVKPDKLQAHYDWHDTIAKRIRLGL